MIVRIFFQSILRELESSRKESQDAPNWTWLVCQSLSLMRMYQCGITKTVFLSELDTKWLFSQRFYDIDHK